MSASSCVLSSYYYLKPPALPGGHNFQIGTIYMKIMICGGDGFCGWATALHLSRLGNEILIVDNFSRRKIDIELGIQSLTPISSMTDRLSAWKEQTGNTIHFSFLDLASEYTELLLLLKEFEPDAMIHFAEQRSAPYSMKQSSSKRYTVTNNISATHNILTAIVESGQDIHLLHLGTMGVYGYGTIGAKIPEGYLNIHFQGQGGESVREILYPTSPGSIYHMTKCLDQQLFAYYAANDGLRITDLHQGIVWGTQTPDTMLDERLINRFDYDGDYGTVLNRFLMQATIGYPLTVHGTGGQTRAFIHLKDSVRCVELALGAPPRKGDKVKILNQLTETFSVKKLATLVSELTGVPVQFLPNPRKESDTNSLEADNACFLKLGLEPTALEEGLLKEIIDISQRYIERADTSRIPCLSCWNKEREITVTHHTGARQA